MLEIMFLNLRSVSYRLPSIYRLTYTTGRQLRTIQTATENTSVWELTDHGDHICDLS